MTSIIERLSYLPCLPTVKAGASGRHVIDYAVCSAIANIYTRDILLFPQGRHGIFTTGELTKAVCAEVQPDIDVYSSVDETEYVEESITGLINSGFLQEDSDGNLSCSYISKMLANLWKGQPDELIESGSTEDDLLPELF